MIDTNVFIGFDLFCFSVTKLVAKLDILEDTNVKNQLGSLSHE